MTDQDDIKNTALARALELFISELGGHVAQFRKTLERSHQLSDDDHYALCSREAKHFEHGFHTIKGGAGFLGLPAIASLANEGEQMFKRGTVMLAKGELRCALERIIGELERHLHTLSGGR